MKIETIRNILNAEVICNGGNLDKNVYSACGSDMMSDVLAYGQGQALLLTVLRNQQVIRTAEMLDMRCIVFVRGKTPGEEVLDLAAEKGIAVACTPHGMFTASGLLYQAGLTGV